MHVILFTVVFKPSWKWYNNLLYPWTADDNIRGSMEPREQWACTLPTFSSGKAGLDCNIWFEINNFFLSWSCLSWSCLSWSCLSWSCWSLSCLSWSCLSWSCLSWSCLSWSCFCLWMIYFTSLRCYNNFLIATTFDFLLLNLYSSCWIRLFLYMIFDIAVH